MWRSDTTGPSLVAGSSGSPIGSASSLATICPTKSSCRSFGSKSLVPDSQTWPWW